MLGEVLGVERRRRWSEDEKLVSTPFEFSPEVPK